MMEFIRKYKIWIAAAAVVVIAAAVFIFRQAGAGGTDGGTAYVETVANLTGQNASLGMVNRFAGIIEPQGTWSVNKNADAEVEEIYVSEGDEVEEGQALFVYSTTKYEEDLQQARIDLERLHNEYDSTVETIAQLEKEKKSASSSEQADYTVQIKEQNLTLKDKDLDIQMKEAEIGKLESNIENAEVKSGITGVVKSINQGGSSSSGSGDNSFITVMKVGTFRVLVHSRVNDRVWKGKITKIDTENALQSDNTGFGMGNSESKSSKYPFYVDLENSDGLIMGQHVYIEPDLEQGEENTGEGIWLAAYMVDQTDPEHPFVWKDVKGRLQKQEVTISEIREELGKVKISEGLSMEDSICIPDGTLTPGMRTAPMSEKPEETESEETVPSEGMETEPSEGMETEPSEGMETEPSGAVGAVPSEAVGGQG